MLDFSNIASATSTTNGAATASFDVPDGGVIYLAVACAYDSTGNGTYCTIGGSLNLGGWTDVVNGGSSDTLGLLYGSRRWMWVWCGVNTSGSPQSGTVTFGFTNDGPPNANYQEHEYSIDLATGANTASPDDAAVSGASTTSVTSFALSDVGTPNAGDAIYAAFGFESGADSFALDAALTQLGSQTGGANVRSFKTGYDADAGDETPSVTWGTSSNTCGGIAFIVNVGEEAPAGSGHGPIPIPQPLPGALGVYRSIRGRVG